MKGDDRVESLNRIFDTEKRAEQILSEARKEARKMKKSSHMTMEAGFDVVKRECERSGKKYKEDQLKAYRIQAVLFDEETERLLEEDRKMLSELEERVIDSVERAVLRR